MMIISWFAIGTSRGIEKCGMDGAHLAALYCACSFVCRSLDVHSPRPSLVRSIHRGRYSCEYLCDEPTRSGCGEATCCDLSAKGMWRMTTLMEKMKRTKRTKRTTVITRILVGATNQNMLVNHVLWMSRFMELARGLAAHSSLMRVHTISLW